MSRKCSLVLLSKEETCHPFITYVSLLIFFYRISPKDLEEGNPIPLRYVKFQNVQNLQIFIKDNQSDAETTRIDHLAIIGSPISTTNMGEFKRVAGKKGESH